jgi:hypothetical protein
MTNSMTKRAARWGLVLATLTGLATSGVALDAAQGLDGARSSQVDLTGSDWEVKSEDSICGVSAARQITNPAKVDYEKLMDATEEMKELKREGIKPDSARGQALVTQARDKVRRAAKAVMTEKGHCSVWKKISHKKNQEVTDITSAVKDKLET